MVGPHKSLLVSAVSLWEFLICCSAYFERNKGAPLKKSSLWKIIWISSYDTLLERRDQYEYFDEIEHGKIWFMTILWLLLCDGWWRHRVDWRRHRRFSFYIFRWFFRQNTRFNLFFPTRYHVMIFKSFFTNLIFSAGAPPGPPPAANEKFLFSKCPL